MTKKSFVFLLSGAALLVGLMLIGCSDMPRHYGQIENYPSSNDYRRVDDPAPEEELCTLIIDSSLRFKGSKGNNYKGSKYSAYYLKIAAGERQLVFDYWHSSSWDDGRYIHTTTSSAKGIAAYHEFEAGRTYSVYPVISGGRVSIGIEETSFPVRPGWRMGPYIGWHRNTSGVPSLSPSVLLQLGLTAPFGNNAMEFIAEGNLGFIGYSPFDEEYIAPFNINAQIGGTANFHFGKSLKKTGFGLGGGVGFEHNGNSEATFHVPYARFSFFPGSVDWHIRLFADYSFAQEDPLWRRLGVGAVFFMQ
jgi:hypothetical protein